MNTEGGLQLHQALISRRDAIADSWSKAIARTSFIPLITTEVRQQLVELTEQAITLLLAESFEHDRAEAIGASLAGLHYVEPEAIGRTQEVLAQQLIEGLSADQVVALQLRLAELFGGLVAGYFEQAREIILSEQEQTRGALTAALRQAKEAVQRAYEEVEQQVQERTAELRGANESLQCEITERKRAEEALRESEERFRGIFENATIGLYRTTPDGRILMANPTLVRMLGYSSFDELVQRNLEENGYEPEYPRPAFKQRIESKGQVFGLESAWVRRDGTTLFIRESARAFRDEAGNTLYYEGTVEDIAERKRAEEALQKAHDELDMRVRKRTAELAKANEALQAKIIERKRTEKYLLLTERLAAMSRLAAALAHEINNPLQGISSSLELALDFPLEEKERQEYLQAARREIERLMGLTDRVLNFARPPRVERQPTSAADVVRDALALASKQLDYSDILVSLYLPDVLPPVLASSSQLAQVFLNLIINAIQALPDGGALSISARLAGEQVEVTFTDSGPGISPDAMARLFEPFYTTKENGTGLGLATSHSIIQQHGGTMTAGNAPGGGAVFTVALPIAPLDKPHLAERR